MILQVLLKVTFSVILIQLKGLLKGLLKCLHLKDMLTIHGWKAK